MASRTVFARGLLRLVLVPGHGAIVTVPAPNIEVKLAGGTGGTVRVTVVRTFRDRVVHKELSRAAGGAVVVVHFVFVVAGFAYAAIVLAVFVLVLAARAVRAFVYIGLRAAVRGAICRRLREIRRIAISRRFHTQRMLTRVRAMVFVIRTHESQEQEQGPHFKGIGWAFI